MIKLFGRVIMSLDDYETLTTKSEQLANALNAEKEANRKAQEKVRESGKKLSSMLRKYDIIEEQLFDLQKKAYVRDEKGRFMRFLKAAVNAENNTNQ